MAKLYLKGRKEPILIDNKDALDLKNDWLTRKLPDIVDIGEHVFDSKDIKGIEDVMKKGEDIEIYDLEVPEQRQAIKDFENQFEKFKEANPDKYFSERDGVKVGYKEHWMYSLNLIGKPYSIGNFGVKEEKISAYISFNNKWSSLQDLRTRRAYVEGKESPPLEQLELKDI